MALNSLKSEKDFNDVFRKGQRFGNRHFQFYYLKNRENTNRLGIIVSKKVSKRAVVRNKIRRRIREAYRLHRGDFKTGYDLIIIAKERCVSTTYAEIEHSLTHLFYKTKLEVSRL
ncbi:ribonuclease P protein component [Pseudoramibacter alactolyticus]|uniref:ribonuclease P protein component n=1 Tax=Pseudoramibacter alactolyticus TaxID=113287 RepID=UPI00248D6880|nr:ribonuclease P protein component [Pseudoramibacter alactolyticus]